MKLLSLPEAAHIFKKSKNLPKTLKIMVDGLEVSVAYDQEISPFNIKTLTTSIYSLNFISLPLDTTLKIAVTLLGKKNLLLNEVLNPMVNKKGYYWMTIINKNKSQKFFLYSNYNTIINYNGITFRKVKSM